MKHIGPEYWFVRSDSQQTESLLGGALQPAIVAGSTGEHRVRRIAVSLRIFDSLSRLESPSTKAPAKVRTESLRMPPACVLLPPTRPLFAAGRELCNCIFLPLSEPPCD